MRKVAPLLVAFALLAVGCGDDDATPADAVGPTTLAPTTSSAPPTTTSPSPAPTTAAPSDATDVGEAEWTQVADGAPWGPRAGLRVLSFDGALYVLGGRTSNQSDIPGDSSIWDDVWRSDDGGRTWELVAPGGEAPHWPARAYFQAVVVGDEMLVIGGQDFGLEANPFCALLEQGLEPPPGLGIDPEAPCPEFIPSSRFFNDVWASTDGRAWEQRTEAAPWRGRAGLGAVALGDDLFVLAGSENDDASIIGPGGPERIYYNDVWRSSDGGARWELVTEAAPWAPRAGAAVLAHDGEIWLFGGEDGFTCDPLPDCDPPYFNDVWRSADGAEWTLVTEAAGWSPRPGHQCERLAGRFVCFGGFGLLENPTDIWASADGASWERVPGAPWNAATPDAIRYDFDSEVVDDTIITVGGDRETFDFDDPENYLRVEDDVWHFAFG